MLVTTTELSNQERLLIERRRTGHTQAQAAKKHKVPLVTYRQWETEGEDAPAVKVGRLSEGEQCFIMRFREGLTVSQVAEHMGVCRWWLCRMERGDAPANRLVEYWS